MRYPLWNRKIPIEEKRNVIKIDAVSEQIIEIFEVGRGPMQLLIDNNQLWISRTYYDEDWTQTFFGASLINIETNEVTIQEYGTGVVCGGDIMKITDDIFRTFEGGVASMNDDLSIDASSKIGTLLFQDRTHHGYQYLSKK